MQKTSKARLQAIVDRINIMTGSPMATYHTENGKLTANIGNYHLDSAYGGWSLFRMQSPLGGVKDVLSVGHITPRELDKLMQAFIRGLEANEEI